MKKTKKEDVMDYPLKNIPVLLWRKARAKGIMEGKTIREIILAFLERYVQDFQG